MAVAVQRLVDDTTEYDADPSVRLLEASVLAAELSSEAAAAANGNNLIPGGVVFASLRGRCERLASDYAETISGAAWTQVPNADLGTDPLTGTPATQWTCRLTARPT